MPERMTPGERDMLATTLVGLADDVRRLDKSNSLLKRQNLLTVLLLAVVLVIGATNRDGVHLIVECTTPSSGGSVHECADRSEAATGQAVKAIVDRTICRFSQLFAPNRPEPPECNPAKPPALPQPEDASGTRPWVWVGGGLAIALMLTYVPWERVWRWRTRGRRRS